MNRNLWPFRISARKRDCLTCNSLEVADMCGIKYEDECPHWQRNRPVRKWLDWTVGRLQYRWRMRHKEPSNRLQKRLDAIFYAICILIAVILFK